jgi:hypothetical protein
MTEKIEELTKRLQSEVEELKKSLATLVKEEKTEREKESSLLKDEILQKFEETITLLN